MSDSHYSCRFSALSELLTVLRHGAVFPITVLPADMRTASRSRRHERPRLQRVAALPPDTGVAVHDADRGGSDEG